MIILRVFLYLICIISIGWSALVFGGPPIIKKLISEYSDGALVPFGVTVSSKLSIGINRLEYNLQNEMEGWNIKGVSRAVEISWSLFGGNPFLEINMGPSVVKDYATADSVFFYTPAFQKIDWKNISFVADIDSLALNSLLRMSSLTMAGNLSIGSAKISNVNIEVEGFSARYFSSNHSAHSITGDLSKLNWNAPLADQLFSSTFVVENLIVSEPNLNIHKTILKISMEEEGRNLNVDLYDLNLLYSDGFIENVKVDGYFNRLNILEELHLASKGGMFFKKSPKFPKISATVIKSGDEQYQTKIEGEVEEFELSGADSYIGLLPRGYFDIDFQIDREASRVTSLSTINFDTLNGVDIVGSLEMNFISEFLKNLGCQFSDCNLSGLDLGYTVTIGDEWVKGSAECPKTFCEFSNLDHLVRTSNTVNIIEILNQTKILNPLSSIYLFGVINSGQKINGGHELKFQF